MFQYKIRYNACEISQYWSSLTTKIVTKIREGSKLLRKLKFPFNEVQGWFGWQISAEFATMPFYFQFTEMAILREKKYFSSITTYFEPKYKIYLQRQINTIIKGARIIV